MDGKKTTQTQTAFPIPFKRFNPQPQVKSIRAAVLGFVTRTHVTPNGFGFSLRLLEKWELSPERASRGALPCQESCGCDIQVKPLPNCKAFPPASLCLSSSHQTGGFLPFMLSSFLPSATEAEIWCCTGAHGRATKAKWCFILVKIGFWLIFISLRFGTADPPLPGVNAVLPGGHR